LRNFRKTYKVHWGLHMGIDYAIFPAFVEFQRTKFKRVCQFSPTRYKSVTIVMSLELAVAIGMFYYDADLPLHIAESLAKIQALW